MPPSLILASGSPRRTELLSRMGIQHIVVPSTVDERQIIADHPRTFAMRAAYAKARDVAARSPKGAWVLAADTVVTHKLLLYGKPDDAHDARRMLRALSGETHEVITALALTQGGTETTQLQAATTRVCFKQLSEQDINAYIATGEPMDKAGAYGIQGHGGELVDYIVGDYYNVVGLPCRLLMTMLEDAGLEIATAIPDAPERWRS